MLDLAREVTDLLNAKYDVLVYSGDKDFICNWRGGEAWSNAVEWDGKVDYQKVEYKDWNVSDKAAGALKTYENLKFLRVFDAGHMVPMNQPEAALQILSELITPSGPLSENDLLQ
jgi:cathepsin A (carboxypeptidase C)